MKKLSVILAALLACAIAVAGVFGYQKSDVSTNLTNMTAERDAVQGKLDESAAKVAELETSVADLTAAAETAAAEAAAELEAAKAEAAAAADTAAAKIAELEASVAELTAAAEVAKTEAAAAAEAAAAELEAAKAEAAAAAETAAAELEAAKAEAAAAAETAAAKIAELEAEVAKYAELAAQPEVVEEVVEEVTEEVTEEVAEEVAETEETAEEVVEEVVEEKDTALLAARSYLRTMYKGATETTPVDYTVVGVVNIGGVEYPIQWTADSETVKIIPGEDKMVTIDVDEKNPEEVTYVLTATLTGVTGQTAEVSFNHKVPAAMILEGLSYEEIVAAAYTLEDGLAMEEEQRLYGTIVKIDTPWSEEYKNITVTIQVGELVDQPIMCYRLSGEGCAELAIGDDITVEGIIKNYKGTIEFDKGCVLVGKGEVVSQAAVLDAAYALEDGAAMPAPTALEGVIVSIDTAWSEDYQNITVSIVCDGKEEQKIMCYRLKGEGAKDLAVGQEIAVAGTIKNYKGTIEFDQGCVLIPFGTANDVRNAMSGYTLEEGLAQEKAKTITGTVVSIDTAWSEDYKNITVTIAPAGLEEYKVMCYRLKGEGAKDLAVGDVITVNGILKNYKGTIEFDAGCTIVK